MLQGESGFGSCLTQGDMLRLGRWEYFCILTEWPAKQRNGIARKLRRFQNNF